MRSNNHITIIAEAGVNHNGSLSTALEMVKVAARAGADYIKFQTFKADKLASARATKADYQKRNTGGHDDSQLSMLKKLELSEEDFATIAEACAREGIGFLSTPFDHGSIDLLSTLGMDFWKIPSGEITDYPYLRHIASKGGRVVLSTGMSTIPEIEEALDVLATGGIPRSNVYLLHCTTQYPTPYEAVNLRAMNALRKLNCAGVGYSDHTIGITVPVAAAALGACIIEKHFTLDNNMEGPDHKASLEPHRLAEMVTAIRDCQLALGSSVKTVTAAERPNIEVARRSIVAATFIRKGELIEEAMITTKRPASGLSPMMWNSVVGTRAIRDFEPDEPLEI